MFIHTPQIQWGSPYNLVREVVCADCQPVDPSRKASAEIQDQDAGDGGVSAKTGCVYARLYDDAQKAELGAP